MAKHLNDVMDFVPWLPLPCVEFLNKYLNITMHGFEYGSGHSTIFFAKRVGGLVSIESSIVFYNDTNNLIRHFDIKNTTLALEPGNNVYQFYISPFPDNYFDFVLVDGKNRVECLKFCHSKIKFGGILILDNSERPDYKPGIDLLGGWKKQDFFPNGKEIEPGEPGWKCTVFKKPS